MAKWTHDAGKSIAFLDRIEQINGYLVREAEAEFCELIESVNSQRDRISTAKPVVKIVSPSATLADNFRKKNLANSQLRSLYEFQAISSISKIQQIIQDCDLICFIYFFKNSINKQHQKLIELARKNNIGSFLLVRQPNDNIQNANLSSWLKAQDCWLDEVQLPLDDFINLNRHSDINTCQQLLLRSLESIEDRFIARHQQALKTLIEVFFEGKIASLEPFNPLLDRPPHYYRQQLEQISNRVRPEKQQLTTRIKQNINCLKFDLLNPFVTESLIFAVRQIIDLAAIKVVPEAEVTYLYLTVNNSAKARYIHDYVIELCQQKIEEIISFQWSQIKYVYGGGLDSLIAKVNDELKTLTGLIDSENDFFVLPRHPSLDLTELIDRDCLKANSRIVFDYHFTQSSWFRLLISMVVGLGIYFITWMLLGSGKYIGLMIVIFQIVNLITGQSPKKVKLKQHSKELKRLVDRQYQILVRLVVDKLVQTLIIAVERHKLDPNELETAIANTRIKLEQSNSAIAQERSKIDILQQQRAKILSWLD